MADVISAGPVVAKVPIYKKDNGKATKVGEAEAKVQLRGEPIPVSSDPKMIGKMSCTIDVEQSSAPLNGNPIVGGVRESLPLTIEEAVPYLDVLKVERNACDILFLDITRPE